jgi:hypothetical protein
VIPVKIARSNTTPVKEFEKFKNSPEGSVVWEQGNRRILVAHLPNWSARDPKTAPKVLAFLAVLGRTYMGTYLNLENAVSALIT